MEIHGRGLIARAFTHHSERAPDAIVFARGVADSAMTAPEGFAREIIDLTAALELARQRDGRLVYFSSAGAIHGPFVGVRDEDTPVNPVTPYGRQQAAAEALIRDSRAPYLIVRLANVVGTRQNPAQLVPSLARQALEGRARLFRYATRDILDVDLAVLFVIGLLEVGLERQTVVVASGHSLPIDEVFGIIQQALGTHADVVKLDKGDVQEFSTKRLVERLGSVAMVPPDHAVVTVPRHLQSLVGSVSW